MKRWFLALGLPISLCLCVWAGELRPSLSDVQDLRVRGDLQVDGAITGAGVVESTVSVNAPILGTGAASDPLDVDKSSFTLLGPTVDHSELSNIGAADHHTKTTDASELTSGTLPLARLDASSVTLLGPIPDHSLLGNVTASQHHTKTTDASELTSGSLSPELVDLSTVTTALDGKVAKAGDTMAGDLGMGDNQITNISTLTVNGDIVRPGRPYSEATKSAGIALSSAAYFNPNFDNEVSDNTGMLTGSTVTVPADGFYEACVGARWSSNSTGSRTIRFLVNAAEFALDTVAAAPGIDQRHNFCKTMNLNAGNTIIPEVRHDGTPATLTLKAGVNSYFTVIKN